MAGSSNLPKILGYIVLFFVALIAFLVLFYAVNWYFGLLPVHVQHPHEEISGSRVGSHDDDETVPKVPHRPSQPIDIAGGSCHVCPHPRAAYGSSADGLRERSGSSQRGSDSAYSSTSRQSGFFLPWVDEHSPLQPAPNASSSEAAATGGGGGGGGEEGSRQTTRQGPRTVPSLQEQALMSLGIWFIPPPPPNGYRRQPICIQVNSSGNEGGANPVGLDDYSLLDLVFGSLAQENADQENAGQENGQENAGQENDQENVGLENAGPQNDQQNAGPQNGQEPVAAAGGDHPNGDLIGFSDDAASGISGSVANGDSSVDGTNGAADDSANAADVAHDVSGNGDHAGNEAGVSHCEAAAACVLDEGGPSPAGKKAVL